RICVWGVHPFLPPLIAAITAMLEGPGEGAAFAGVFGLLCDLTMPGIIPCFYTLAFLAAALLAAVIAKRFLSQGFLCAVLCAGIRYNPNTSMEAIEGITSPDGRIFGKMGHSERTGVNVCKNVSGNKDQKIFENGVRYFK
ncbi:phosphoribosylformylglycinamidine synthase, partial [human gut metagenome]